MISVPEAGLLPIVPRPRVRRAFAKRADWSGGWLQMGERSDIREAETQQIRYCERARFGTMPERVPSDIAVIRGVGQLADSYAVEHDPNDSLKNGHRQNSQTP